MSITRRGFLAGAIAAAFAGPSLLFKKAEPDFVAYTIPNMGRIPERQVKGDYVYVPMYKMETYDFDRPQVLSHDGGNLVWSDATWTPTSNEVHKQIDDLIKERMILVGYKKSYPYASVDGRITEIDTEIVNLYRQVV